MESPQLADQHEETLSAYLEEIKRYPLLEPDEEMRLARGVRRGDREALGRLVEGNLRFVVSYSKIYRNQGLPYPDLIGAGNVGLLEAAHRFDETRGVRFITYAVWWIRQAITDALAESGRIVRLPVGKQKLLGRVTRRKEELAQLMGREPTADEIAESMELAPRDVEEMLAVGGVPVSLDEPTVPGGFDALVDSLPDALAPEPDCAVLEQSRNASLEAALATLGARAEAVVRRSFGLGRRDPQTNDEIGAALGLSRERVRQIREKALFQLRRSPHAGELDLR